MSVRVRFAPSPTGQVHIGNIRAAIFNWLFARHEGGRFLLRIEDTDRERSTPEAIRSLLSVMEWLGLAYDEPALYQTAQLADHQAAARRMEARGFAYTGSRVAGEAPATWFRIPCDCEAPDLLRTVGPVEIAPHPEAPVEVDATGVRFALPDRKGAPSPQESGLAGMRDLRLWAADGRLLFDLTERLPAVLARTDGFKAGGVARMTFTRRELVYRDQVKGELAKPLDGLKDFVIIRASGAPVFHLANVCDDVTQGVTHIIRGDDHVENTYRHLFMFLALGATPPRYAHLPMIVNQSGKPYSKRDGDAYVGDFRDKGFLPEALFNYLALLGWSPGDDLEKMTRAEMVARFTLDRVKSAPAQMDIKKLTHLNQQYIAELPADRFVELVRPRAAVEAWGAALDDGAFRRVCALMQSRAATLAQVAEWGYFFTALPAYEEESVRKLLRKPGVGAVLRALRAALAEPTVPFDEPGIEQALRRIEPAHGIAEGKLNQPVRVAVTGVSRGAGLYETMALLGRDVCLRRLDHAIATLTVD